MLLPLIVAFCISPVDEPVLPEAAAPPPMILERLGEHRRPVATDSAQARQWFDQGLALMYGFNFDGAIASFLQATSIDPQFAMAYINRGNVRKAKGDLDGAIEDYEKALEVAPENWRHRGTVEGNLEKARKALGNE